MKAENCPICGASLEVMETDVNGLVAIKGRKTAYQVSCDNPKCRLTHATDLYSAPNDAAEEWRDHCTEIKECLQEFGWVRLADSGDNVCCDTCGRLLEDDDAVRKTVRVCSNCAEHAPGLLERTAVLKMVQELQARMTVVEIATKSLSGMALAHMAKEERRAAPVEDDYHAHCTVCGCTINAPDRELYAGRCKDCNDVAGKPPPA